jgi:NADPH-dependent curcumin reductase CurA
MARQSLQLELAERPKGEITPGKTFRLRQVPAPTEADLKDGQLLLESLYISFDPAMRGWLDDRRSYVPPVQIGEVMRAMTISRVLASRSAKAKAGDIVTATMGIREVGIMPEAQVEPASALPLGKAGGKVTDLLGVLGMTGLTAYFGMTKIGEPKAGETVVVSAAAGATGSVAAQIAKIAGARVIGTAGSDEKCRWLKEELGLDVALNYKDPDFKEKFKAATPNFIDVFFDNGEIIRPFFNEMSSNANRRGSSRWRAARHGSGPRQHLCPVRYVRRYLPV